VEGCESGGGRGRGEGTFCQDSCVGRCRSSLQWPGHTRGQWQRDCNRSTTSGRIGGDFFRLLYILSHHPAANYFTRMDIINPSPQAFKQHRGSYFLCREEDEIALAVVVLVVLELLLDGGIQSSVDVEAPRCVAALRMSRGIRGDRSRRR
jgi:hypothetical protein